MSLQEMLDHIQKKLQEECFTDAKDETGNSSSTVWQWKNGPPEKPSLHVFCRMARWAGLNPTIDQLEELF